MRTINCIFCRAFSIWSLALAEKPQKDEILSAGCALKPLIVCFIYLWWCVMYCWRQQTRLLWLKANCHLRQLWLLRITHSHVNIRDTHSEGRKTHHHTHSHCVYLLFPTLSPVLHEWQSYFLHRLDYYSIKPVIGLDSSYLSPLEYGSL